MKKSKWFKLLKKELRGLPNEEQHPVIDYYEELYADKRESGLPEWQIIAEFDNPAEIGKRVKLESFENSLNSGKPVRVKYGENYGINAGRLVALILLLTVFGLPFFLVALAFLIILWAVVISLLIFGAGAVLCGFMFIISTFMAMPAGVLWSAYLGLALIGLGLGTLLTIGMAQSFKPASRLSARYVRSFARLGGSIKKFIFE